MRQVWLVLLLCMLSIVAILPQVSLANQANQGPAIVGGMAISLPAVSIQAVDLPEGVSEAQVLKAMATALHEQRFAIDREQTGNVVEITFGELSVTKVNNLGAAAKQIVLGQSTLKYNLPLEAGLVMRGYEVASVSVTGEVKGKATTGAIATNYYGRNYAQNRNNIGGGRYQGFNPGNVDGTFYNRPGILPSYAPAISPISPTMSATFQGFNPANVDGTWYSRQQNIGGYPNNGIYNGSNCATPNYGRNGVAAAATSVTTPQIMDAVRDACRKAAKALRKQYVEAATSGGSTETSELGGY